MKKIFILLLAALFIYSGCTKEENTKQVEEIKSVSLTLSFKKQLQRELKYTGIIYAWEEAALAAQMSARVRKIFVREGDYVKKGDLLVQMDDNQLTQVELQYTDAQRDFERAKKLMQEGAFSDQAYEKAKTAYETLKTNYEKILENTQLKAPFSGVITEKFLNDGEVFLMTPSGSRGVPAILYLMDLSELKIKVSLPESDAAKVFVGQRALIQSELMEDKSFAGTVYRINPVVDKDTKTVLVEIKLENRGFKHKVGSIVSVSILLKKTEELLIPTSSILTDPLSGENFVYVFENGIAKKRVLMVAGQFESFTSIASGLNENEKVISAGQHLLSDGDKVKEYKEKESGV